MANKSTDGKEFLLYTRTGGTTDAPTWEAVVCLTSTGFTGSTTTNSSSTRCSGDYVNSSKGEKSWSISGEAESVIETPEAGTASHKKYLDLWKSGADFDAIVARKGVDLADADSIEVRGTVFVSDIDTTYPQDGFASFTMTLQGQGEPFFTPEA